MCIRDSSYPLPSLSLSLPVRSRHPQLRLRSLGERLSSPAGPGGARPPSAFWRILCLNWRLFEYLMQHTDTLSHNKYRIETLSSLNEQVVLSRSNSSVGTQKGGLRPCFVAKGQTSKEQHIKWVAYGRHLTNTIEQSVLGCSAGCRSLYHCYRIWTIRVPCSSS